MKVGILGGTFDPVHNAHLIIAEYVRAELPLHKILFIPAAIPPHKQDVSISSPSHRLAMLHLAVSSNPAFDVYDFEITRGGVSYTIDTVRNVKQDYKLSASDTYVIMGSDNLNTIENWYQPEELVQESRIVVVQKPDNELGKIPSYMNDKVVEVKTPLLHISSTDIRERVREGKSIKYLVPDAVAQFIQEKGLYK